METRNEAARIVTRKALTANRLGDGLVVFLTKNGSWSQRIDDAVIATGHETYESLEMAGVHATKLLQVVSPYLIEIDSAGEEIRPKRLRERIRAFGPTASTAPAV